MRQRSPLRVALRMPGALLSGVAVLAAMSLSGPTANADTFVGEQAAGVGILATPGDTVVFGANGIYNHSDEAIVLRSAQLLPVEQPAGVEVIAVRVVDSTGRGVLAAGQWPRDTDLFPPGALYPVAGYRVPPGAHPNLMFVVRVDAVGRWTWPGTQVRYTSSTGTFTAGLDISFEICSDDPDPNSGCPGFDH